MKNPFKHKHDTIFCAECTKIYANGMRHGTVVNERTQNRVFSLLQKVDRLEFENRVLKQALKLECAEAAVRSPGGCTE